jgi:hypothetical protein
MKNLVITTIGEYNHYDTWAGGRPIYDLYPIDYRINPTFKYQGIAKALLNNSYLLDYDYYWMPDEDVWVEPFMLNTFFKKMDEHSLWIGQPSVLMSNDSFPSWKDFIHQDNEIELINTNFIEVMCPCFSKDALIKCLPTFSKSMSGWGLDLVWSKIGDGNKMGIINSVIVKHTRPVRGGALYKALDKKGIHPSQERKRLMREYGIESIDIKTWI